MVNKEEGNIKNQFNSASTGINLDQSLNQLKKGTLSYALNANVENFDSNSINYQNEQGNEFCFKFSKDYVLIGKHFIPEQSKHIFFTTNPITGDCEIGYTINNDCNYKTLINNSCLGWNINSPIHKVVHRITNCSTEIFWADNIARRHLDIDNIPYKLSSGTKLCSPIYTTEIDCNQLKVQPDFNIPNIDIVEVITGGNLISGTYQFGIQYSDSIGNPYTSYYSITNPTPIADLQITSVNFNYPVGKSIVINIDNIDITGQFQYFNLSVIKTINNISSVELVGTYFIDNNNIKITYTGQSNSDIKLSINDIFEKFPYYELADDITAVQDVLVWKGLTSIDRVNYQKIANQINLKWQTYRIPANEDYSDELNTTNLRGYLRDEIYPFEIVFELKNGKQTDGFHIPGRVIGFSETSYSDIPNTHPDFIGNGDSAPYWKIYNTASVTDFAEEYNTSETYKGPYQYGEFAYWESEDEYPCNVDLWGDLAGKKIRHHKFPDDLISPIIESKIYSGILQMGDVAKFPIGVRVDTSQIQSLINTSELTSSQKDDIVGFKIVRGDRSSNKSIIGKGILRNVNEYEREGQKYYYPNYPYNDLSEDPFLNASNNAWNKETSPWLITCNEIDVILGHALIEFTNSNTGKKENHSLQLNETIEICSLTRPITNIGVCTIGPGNYDVWYVSNFGSLGERAYWSSPFTNDNLSAKDFSPWIKGSCFASAGATYAIVNVGEEPTLGHNTGFCGPNPFAESDLRNTYVEPINVSPSQIIPNVSRRSPLICGEETPIPKITSSDSNYRQIFNSPETSFGQPFLGNVLKIENVMYGAGKGHFVEVKNNAKYKLLTLEAQKDALESSENIGTITSPFNAQALFAAYQAYLTIYINGITRKNYAYSYNSIADYNYIEEIPNNGNKQRQIDFTKYLIPSVQSISDNNGISINNYQRESSVFIKTKENTPLEFPSEFSPVKDESRITIGNSYACSSPSKEQLIKVVSYYASMKNLFDNQWGQIYSYETIDTGFHSDLSGGIKTIFGGDTFISRFGFKTKLPFFIDNRVGAPDDSDIFYDEIGNVGYPKFWHSSRSILENAVVNGQTLSNFLSYKAHNFDCYNNPSSIESGSYRTYYDGYFYLFAYGIPYFYCESSYNTELRQAFNNREGDYYPHVSTGIPDDWLQEDYVSIINDNTYNYNVTFSKQNKENEFTHLPIDWGKECYTKYPFRAIYSDPQIIDSDNRINSWLIYRSLSYYDFPQNYGKLISLDGIQNKAVLARFENKSLLYNNLLTIDTSNPQAAYVGNPKLFDNPPIDYADTDLGYVGSQHKFLLKIPEGQITVDSKRGQIFLIQGTQALDISGFGSGLNRFLTDNLSFNILKSFPNINIDNHFNGIGIHGVYDGKFNRVIITKLDYAPLDKNIKFNDSIGEFYIEKIVNNLTFRDVVYLNDTDYFCNKSWTLSYNLNTKSWISFHSYIPNFYIPENNFFYSGVNDCCNYDIEALVGELVEYTTTTTTTIYYPGISTTTTTTTLIPIDCELNNGVFIQTDCELEATAIITVPSPTTTTTTTICTRPSGLEENVFYSGYVSEGITTTTIIDEVGMCDGINTFNNLNETIVLLYFTINAQNLNVNNIVYYDSSKTDCVTVPDGWYYTEESANDGYGYHVVGGIITEIYNCTSI